MTQTPWKLKGKTGRLPGGGGTDTMETQRRDRKASWRRWYLAGQQPPQTKRVHAEDRLNCALPNTPPPRHMNSCIDALAANVTVSGDRDCKKVIKVKEVTGVGT